MTVDQITDHQANQTADLQQSEQDPLMLIKINESFKSLRIVIYVDRFLWPFFFYSFLDATDWLIEYIRFPLRPSSDQGG